VTQNIVKLVSPMESIIGDIYKKIEESDHTQGWLIDSFRELEKRMDDLEEKFLELITKKL